MNQPRRKRPDKRRQQKPKPKALEMWRPVPALPDPEPITPASEPAALIRSLGHPPLQGQGAVAEHYLAAVVEAAARREAVALAAAAGLLSFPTDDD